MIEAMVWPCTRPRIGHAGGGSRHTNTRGAAMSRPVLCGIVSWLVLGSGAPARADDTEDKAAALAEKLGGTVTRDDKRPGKPVVAVDLHGRGVRGADLRALGPLQSLTAL